MVPVDFRVSQERGRQRQLKEEGRFENTPSDPISNERRLAMLTEELGEVAREVMGPDYEGWGSGDTESLKKELIQVAAIATAWILGLEARESPDEIPF